MFSFSNPLVGAHVLVAEWRSYDDQLGAGLTTLGAASVTSIDIFPYELLKYLDNEPAEDARFKPVHRNGAPVDVVIVLATNSYHVYSCLNALLDVKQRDLLVVVMPKETGERGYPFGTAAEFKQAYRKSWAADLAGYYDLEGVDCRRRREQKLNLLFATQPTTFAEWKRFDVELKLHLFRKAVGNKLASVWKALTAPCVPSKPSVAS